MISSVDEAVAVLSEFTKNRRWGSIEFEFRGGDLVFIRKNETLIPSNVKNSSGHARGYDGADDRHFTTNR